MPVYRERRSAEILASDSLRFLGGSLGGPAAGSRAEVRNAGQGG
eukprot:gene16311-15853_t